VDLFTTPPVDLFGGPPATSTETNTGPVYADPTASAKLGAQIGIAKAPTFESNLAGIQEAIAQYKDLIEINGEDTLRTQAAADQYRSDTTSAMQMLANLPTQDPQVTSLANGVVQQQLGYDIQARKSAAIERDFVDRVTGLAASGDTAQASIVLRAQELGGPGQMYRDMMTKNLIMQNRLQQLSANRENQNILMYMLNFGVDLIDPYSASRVGLVDLPKGQKHWADWLFSHDRQTRESQALWNLPIEDFTRVLDEQVLPNIREKSTLFHIADPTEAASLLSELNKVPSAIEQGAWSTMDIAGVIPVGEIMSIPKMFVVAGARREAGALTAKFMATVEADSTEAALKATGQTTDDFIEATAPSIINTNPTENLLPLVAETETARLEREALTASKVGDLQQPGTVLTPTERDAIIAENVKDIEASFGAKSVLDVAVADAETVSTGQQIHELIVRVGKQDGGMYARESGALKRKAELGDLGAEVKQDASGGWYLEFRTNMRETGLYVAGRSPIERTMVGSYLYSAAHTGDEVLHGMALMSGSIKGEVLARIGREYGDFLGSLTKPELNTVDAALRVSNEKQRWFTEAEFSTMVSRSTGRAMTAREWEAYSKSRELFDIDYTLRNDEIFTQLHRGGNKTVSIGKWTNLTGRVDRKMTSMGADRVFDVENNIHYTRNRPLSPKDLKRLREEGYVIVHLTDGINIGDGALVRSFLTKQINMIEEPLARTQLGYKAGGHTMYTDKWFAKQARIHTQPNGGKALMSPGTFVAGTKAEVSMWVAAMNDVRKLVKSGQASANGIDEILERYGVGSFASGDQVLKDFKDGKYQLDHEFEVNFDRQNPDIYNRASDYERSLDDTETSFQQYMKTNGRMFYGSKGEGLKDWQGRRALVVDPFTTINRTMENIATVTSMADYKVNALEHWVQAFKPYTQFSGMDVSPFKVFSEGKIVRGSKIARAAESQRAVTRRILGWKSDFDMEMKETQSRIRSFIEGADPTTSRHKFVKTTVDWWNDANPVRAMKEFAFDSALGFFNIAQMPLQAMSSISSVALNPRFGMKAMLGSPDLILYITKSGTDAMLDQLVRRGAWKSAGFESAEAYKTFMRKAKESGWFNIKTTHALVNDGGPNALGSGIGRGYTKFKEWGRSPFYAGETLNYAIAFRMGWEDVAAEMPEAAAKADEFFMSKVFKKADDYSFNMREQSKAGWQHGLTSIPTQFWAYNARMLEVFLGKSFTPQQKLQLFVVQSLIYGAAANPVLSAVFDAIRPALASDLDPKQNYLDTVAGMIDRGLMDEVAYHLFGADVALGKRFGSGSWLPQMIQEIFGWSEYGEKSLFEWAGGASVGITGGAIGAGLDQVVRYAKAEMGDDNLDLKDFTPDTIKAVLGQISSSSNLMKALTVLKYNEWVTRSGSVPVHDVPTANAAFTILFGAQPGKIDLISAMMKISKDDSQVVKDAARMVSNYRSRMINEPDHREQLTREIQIVMSTLPPHLRKKVIRKVNQGFDRSMYESLEQQIRKRNEAINNGPTD